MSRRARSRRDKRAPIPDFDDPQPRIPGLFISGAMTTPGWPAADRDCNITIAPHVGAFLFWGMR